MSEPLVKFGLMSDVQYADKDDKGVGEGGRVQYFRSALPKLRDAVSFFNQRKSELKFVAHLGDIIDGHYIYPPGTPLVAESRKDLESTASVMDTLEVERVLVIGNHCLQVPRKEMMQRLGIEKTYFATSLAPGWRLLVLDTTEVNVAPMEVEREPSALDAEARAWWDDEANKDKEWRQIWNSTVGSEQREWIAGELQAAERAGERVIVFGHHPVGWGAASLLHFAWDRERLEELFLSSKAFVAYFNGHDHAGGYAERDGRHFVTLEAILEAPEGSNAYGVVSVHEDKIVVEGHGELSSRVLHVPPAPQARV
ncbi:unnamed protein product [Pedinophyceae sp. YPF-701]|nr:unnamed protein product [Pedinophyceae sp. YPF-701]